MLELQKKGRDAAAKCTVAHRELTTRHEEAKAFHDTKINEE